MIPSIFAILVATSVHGAAANPFEPAATPSGTTHDVAAFGVIAGDGLDDSAAIHAAIAAMAPGDALAFPAGVFHLSRQIYPVSQTKIEGAGIDLTTFEFLGTTASSMLRLSLRDDVEVSGFTLDGGNNPLVLQGIVGNGGSQLHIHDIRVRNLVATGFFGPHGVYFDNTAMNVTIEDCRFENIGLNATFGSGIRLNNGSNDAVVQRNTIENTGRGGIHISGSTGAVVRENQVSGSGQFAEGLGIELFNGSHDAVVEDNAVDHWISVDRSSRSAIRRNVISDDAGATEFAGLELVGSSDVLFVDNIVDSGAEIGFSVSNTATKERIYFAGNLVRRAKRWGAQISGEPGSITQQLFFYDNTFSRTGPDQPITDYGHGFRIKADTGPVNHIVLKQNRFLSNEGIGLQLAGNQLDQVVLLRNRIFGNEVGAVSVGFLGTGPFQGNDLLAERNRARRNGSILGNYVPESVGFVNSQSPDVQITAPRSVCVGDTVTFGFEFEDDGIINNILWDLGAGTPETMGAPSRVYTEPGRYQIHLVVWDDDGNAGHATRRVRVRPAD